MFINTTRIQHYIFLHDTQHRSVPRDACDFAKLNISSNTSQVIDCASAISCTLLTPKPQNKATPTTKQSNSKTKQLQCLFFQRDTRECIISNGRDTRECIISNSFFQELYIWRSSWMKVPIPFRVLQKNELDK